MRLFVPLLILCAAARADNSAVAPAAVRGAIYENWSPLADGPVGPIDAAVAARLLPRFIAVTTTGDVTDVLFLPDGAVRWRVVRERGRMVEKQIFVDGELWLTSRFRYDAAGRLSEKSAEGPGLPDGARWSYRLDGAGRIVERANGDERWTVRWDALGATAESTRKGVVERSDRYDRGGRILRSEFGGNALDYRRDASGALVGIERRRHGKRAPARFDARDPTVQSGDLSGIPPVVERAELLLLLGAPATHSVDGHGAARATRDDYSPSCWLNSVSTVRYDAADLARRFEPDCICGFCVDARAELRGDQIDGVDEHFTDGPWLRLDGELDLTADHELMTPSGPRAAGELRPGDLVLDQEGRPRALRTVERLPPATRLGKNLRTRSGYFSAGNFRVVSETPRACVSR